MSSLGGRLREVRLYYIIYFSLNSLPLKNKIQVTALSFDANL